MPRLLRVLFLGYAWLPVAMALFAAHSLRLQRRRARARASPRAVRRFLRQLLLVAMVTRVTGTISGRPLVFGGVATFAFVAISASA